MKKTLTLLFLLLLAVLLVSCGVSATGSGAGYQKISAQSAKARIDSQDELTIVDVRTEEEFLVKHIENAILIPNETITTEKPALLPDLDAEILIYCRSGNRSAQAAKKLVKLGYRKIYDLGGINDWPYATVSELKSSTP
ncbi:MAG: rhodanese-like domain-containing protein [Negativicutes bacterium]|nr:rhodanese-like domain-containing protein [Negativicutes bacterium]